MLSRRNLSLQIERVGDNLLVSLVDLNTGRVAASTKVDQLPADCCCRFCWDTAGCQ